jgi:ubiquinone/menaquinone biosynthesis C-methylase UbiE
VLVFFLLHEQPEQARRATLAEAMRVLRPGGKLVVVDYHRPAALHPLRPFMRALLARLEPFALDLWRRELSEWMPSRAAGQGAKRLFYGGLYQMVEFER